jgi:hypothetical protein
MKSLLLLANGNAPPYSDVVLVSAEKEELHAYKNILATHSRVNLFKTIKTYNLNMMELIA